jgi:hypothetical protein
MRQNADADDVELTDLCAYDGQKYVKPHYC